MDLLQCSRSACTQLLNICVSLSLNAMCRGVLIVPVLPLFERREKHQLAIEAERKPRYRPERGSDRRPGLYNRWMIENSTRKFKAHPPESVERNTRMGTEVPMK
jgi:hypothetical protein